MPGPERAHGGFFLGAHRLRRRAAGAEAAAGRRRGGGRKLTADRGRRGPAGHRVGRGVDQRPGVVVRRGAEQFLGRTGLDELAQVHHDHLVGEVVNHRQIVRDHQVADVALGLQVGHEVENLRAHRHVKRGDGLVGHDQRGTRRQRPGEADPLPLAAGQFPRVAVELPGRDADLLGQPPHPGAAVGAADAAARPQRLLDDAVQGHPRVQRRVRVLEHHLDLVPGGPALAPSHGGDRRAPQPHVTTGRLLQADHQPTEGRLAAPGLADDAHRGSGRHGQAYPGHREHGCARARPQAAAAVVLADVGEFEQRRPRLAGIAVGTAGFARLLAADDRAALIRRCACVHRFASGTRLVSWGSSGW